MVDDFKPVQDLLSKHLPQLFPGIIPVMAIGHNQPDFSVRNACRVQFFRKDQHHLLSGIGSGNIIDNNRRRGFPRG